MSLGLLPSSRKLFLKRYKLRGNLWCVLHLKPYSKYWVGLANWAGVDPAGPLQVEIVSPVVLCY